MGITKDQAIEVKAEGYFIFRTGVGDNFLVAKAIPVGNFGTVGCMVEVIEILDQGPGNEIDDGDVESALYSELEIPMEETS